MSACCAYPAPAPASTKPGPRHSPWVREGAETEELTNLLSAMLSCSQPSNHHFSCFQRLSSLSAYLPLVSPATLTAKMWLHTVPDLSFFVAGATSHLLQLLVKVWPFHLLYSHRTSLSSRNLTISRDPDLQLQSGFQALLARWPLYSASHSSVKEIFPMQSP